MKNAAHNKQGFTLIELLVGVAVFALVITIALGLFMTALRSQRKSIAIQNVCDNARYLFGFMAKEIRMSKLDAADGEITQINITHPVNGSITYSFTGTQILRNGQPINSDEVQIDGRFFIDGKTIGDNQQPKVTIVMEVTNIGTKTEEQAEIKLQTTLSQRELD
jgi:prepilin-type N-terminal cleavage/methylation domain-containing protein